jgi:hypothetical protein
VGQLGSLKGQIAGAAVGASALPAALVGRLRERKEIAAIVESFARIEQRSRP